MSPAEVSACTIRCEISGTLALCSRIRRPGYSSFISDYSANASKDAKSPPHARSATRGTTHEHEYGREHERTGRREGGKRDANFARNAPNLVLARCRGGLHVRAARQT